MESFNPQWLGTAGKVKIDAEKTIVVEGKGKRSAIDQRKKLLESQIAIADSDWKKKDLKKRLAKLAGGVAVIRVGAATETEMTEKKMRIDDALNATKAAVEEGVVSGGGLTLFQAMKELDALRAEGDEKIGVEIVRRSLEEPVRQIAMNAGREGAEVIARLKTEKDGNIGYNAKKDVFEDLFKSGVIDPTKVVRTALQNAASIAAMMITTEALVTEFEEEKDEKSPMVIM